MPRSHVWPLLLSTWGLLSMLSLASPRAASAQAAPPPPPPRKSRAADPDRTAALIGSSIGFGVGAAVTGAIYGVQFDRDQRRCHEGETRPCGHPSARASLVGYGAIVTIVPSLPRFVVGDTLKGLVFSGLRGVSVLTAVFVPWGDEEDTRWQGPFLLAFAAPAALGIIDLATTPHREDLEPQVAGITGVAPVPVVDGLGGAHGALLSLSGFF